MSDTEREAQARFDAKWTPEPNTGCWLWMGGLDGRRYGFFRGDSRATTKKAHRWAWMFYRGSIPEGMVMDHMCRQKLCVNPDHLRPVTHRINTIENCGRV